MQRDELATSGLDLLILEELRVLVFFFLLLLRLYRLGFLLGLRLPYLDGKAIRLSQGRESIATEEQGSYHEGANATLIHTWNYSGIRCAIKHTNAP